MLAVGAKNSVDSGKPRPLIIIENIVKHNEKDIKTCTDELALGFLECMKTFFSEEDATVAGRFNLNNNLFNPYILKKYGLGSIPMLRFSISRSLFLNDTYFSYDYLRIDDIRISELRKMIWKGIEKFSYKYL